MSQDKYREGICKKCGCKLIKGKNILTTGLIYAAEFLVGTSIVCSLIAECGGYLLLAVCFIIAMLLVSASSYIKVKYPAWRCEACGARQQVIIDKPSTAIKSMDRIERSVEYIIYGGLVLVLIVLAMLANYFPNYLPNL